MESAGFSWDGLYAGAQFGGLFYRAPERAYSSIGVHAGVNFVVADPILLGLEATADYLNNGGVGVGQYFANARVGALVTDQVLLYAIAGVGVETIGGFTNGIYQLGAGVELAVTEDISVRGQLTGLGFFDPIFRANALDGARATVGVSYHF
ncbi:MAG: hypothetical protein JWQ22_2100 [Devosia sp.]|nr:hypothetical protein [Devosia sp.]